MNKKINLNYIFKKMTVLIFMEDKTCKTCERTMDINNLMKDKKLVKCAYQIKEPVITNINIDEMRFKEKDMKKMRNIEKRSRTTIKHFNLKLLVVLFVIVQ